MPDVSVIIPTYNYAQFICEAIESVLQQVYVAGGIEIIVVDDGSTDNTKSVLQPYITKGLLTYIYQRNQGKAQATATAIRQARGNFIFNLDADDFFDQYKVASTVAVFDRYHDVVHVASPARLVNKDAEYLSVELLPSCITGKPVHGYWLLQFFYRNNILFGGGSTYAARASVLKKITIPPEVDMYIDEFLVMAVLPQGRSFFIRQPLSSWRVHQANFSGQATNLVTQLQKQQRLLQSSGAVLEYLQQAGFYPEIVRIYQLQHATRRVSFKEQTQSKELADIWQYASQVFFHIKPGWHVIRKYHVLKRLLPSGLLRVLKPVKQRLANYLLSTSI